MKSKKRSPNIVPQIIQALQTHSSFTCKLSELPKSYQKQPHNLAAKVIQRGGIQVNAVVNVKKDTFVLIKFVTSQKSTQPT